MVHAELQEWRHKVDGKGAGAHLCLPVAAASGPGGTHAFLGLDVDFLAGEGRSLL